MKRISKALLVWLVMLALPAQGFAAATMLFCGPMHERMSAAAGVEGPVHHHSGAINSDHDHQAATTGEAVEVRHGVASDLGKSDDLSKFSCSACATCCVGAALVASATTFPLRNQAHERIFSASFPQAGFVTGGPHRPPRSFLA